MRGAMVLELRPAIPWPHYVEAECVSLYGLLSPPASA